MIGTSRKNNIIGILVLVVALTCTIRCASLLVVAESQSSNVSYNCDVTQVNTGQEVRFTVSTAEMCISTFIAYVEYDGNMLEYQGYENVHGTVNGEITLNYNTSTSTKSKEVVVEHGEKGYVVGMYSIGTSDVTYNAANPLVTLVFKAKADGSIKENSFTLAETSDGPDGYTSESIREASHTESSAENSGEASNNVTTSTKQNSANKIIVLFVGVAVLIVAAVVLYVVLRKRR